MSFASGEPESDEEWEAYDKGYREAMNAAPTPDTSPGDELSAIVNELSDSSASRGWLDCKAGDEKVHPRNDLVSIAKDRLNRLIERELMNELKSIVNFNNDIGGKLPWEIGTGRYIQDRIAAIDAQLNKEEK